MGNSEKITFKGEVRFKRIKEGYFWWMQYQKYMSVLKIQNENDNEKKTQMQTKKKDQR